MKASNPPPPAKLADFEIVRRLGTGGMAEVFLAKKRGAEGTFKLLVVKRILPAHGSSRRFRTMFAEEAQLATRLNHPNIVQVYDFQDYEQEGQLLSMEYVEGPDLRRLSRAIRRAKQRMPPLVAAYIVSEVAKGLHYAHERRDEEDHPLDIVHRDISPQNVLLSIDGAVKVADFGIATANVFREESGVLKGKVAYMSPEQARGDSVDRRTDIYSLGVLFHELLTGKYLHGSLENRELLEAVRAGNVDPPSLFVRGIPVELETIVMKALSKAPADRFSTAREMASEITRVLFQKQQLVDAHTLEEVIEQFIPRTVTSPGRPLPDVHDGEASQTGSETGRGLDEVEGLESLALRSKPESGGRLFARRSGREVRHVTIVCLRFHGRADLERLIGEEKSARLADQLRSTLDDLAFKHGTRFSWSEHEAADGKTAVTLGSALATVGLTVNPSAASMDAARMAIDIHEAIAGACVGFPAQLQVSLGIVRGTAEGRRDSAGYLTHHTLKGPASSIAEALGQSASPGQTLCAGWIYRLLRSDFIWQETQNVEVSWDTNTPPRPIRAYALKRQLSQHEKRAQVSLAPRDLVGRNAELGELHAAYHQAVASAETEYSGHLVVRAILGEMGIGKTALITTFLQEVPPDARKLRVECTVHMTEVPYSSAGQWLRELTGIRHEEPIEQAERAIADVLDDLPKKERREGIVRQLAGLAVGQFAGAAGEDEAEATSHRRSLIPYILHFFIKAAQQSPLIVTIDALQWIDALSLELLASLMKREVRLPVLLLLVTRPDERIGWLLHRVVSMELSGLGREHQTRLVEAHVRATAGVAEACAELIPRAAGNPFFLLEMVETLLERGVLELHKEGEQVWLRRSDASDDTQASALPSSLEQLLADRLNELPPQERAIVDWLAVAAGPLSEPSLSALVAADSSEAISSLLARGMCYSQEDKVDVRHPLTRDVAYLALRDDERPAMHQNVGELLSRDPIGGGLGAAVVARHFSRGLDQARAADYYLEAANVARLGFQLPLAARYYRAALQALPLEDPRRLQPHALLEELCRVQGRWEERRTHLEALREFSAQASKPSWVALSLTRQARFESEVGNFVEALRLVRLGIKLARQTGSERQQMQSHSLEAAALRDLGRMLEALSVCDAALEAADDKTLLPRCRAEALRVQSTILMRVGRVLEAIDGLAEAAAIFRLAGSRTAEADATNLLAMAVMVNGDYEDAISLSREALQLELSLGGRFQVARTISNIAQGYARLGEAQSAKNYFEKAMSAHTRFLEQVAQADTLLWNAAFLVEFSKYDEAEQLIARAETLGSLSATAYDRVHAELLRGRVAMHRRETKVALGHAVQARKRAESHSCISLQFYAMALEAAARMEMGERHAAVLLATTSIGGAETLQGCEHALEIRLLALETLEAAEAKEAPGVRGRVAAFATQLSQRITSRRLRRSFRQRPTVAKLLSGDDSVAEPSPPRGAHLRPSSLPPPAGAPSPEAPAPSQHPSSAKP